MKQLEGHVQDVPTIQPVARLSFIWTDGANMEALINLSATARLQREWVRVLDNANIEEVLDIIFQVLF